MKHSNPSRCAELFELATIFDHTRFSRSTFASLKFRDKYFERVYGVVMEATKAYQKSIKDQEDF